LQRRDAPGLHEAVVLNSGRSRGIEALHARARVGQSAWNIETEESLEVKKPSAQQPAGTPPASPTARIAAARRIKKELKIPIVMGHAHATFFPEILEEEDRKSVV
jgi:hypothetical protein